MEIEKLIEILRGKCAVCKRSSCNGKYWVLSSCPAMGEAATALEQLQAELERVKQLYESEKEDFIDYACSGVPNISPYCTNRHPDCVDERGWCRTEKCHGFSRNRDQKEDI